MLNHAILLRQIVVVRIVLQEGFVILPAVENTDDGYRVVFDGKRDDGSFAVVGSAKAESHIIAFCSTKRKRPANPGLPRPAIRRRRVSSGVAGARRCGWPCAWAVA